MRVARGQRHERCLQDFWVFVDFVTYESLVTIFFEMNAVARRTVALGVPSELTAAEAKRGPPTSSRSKKKGAIIVLWFSFLWCSVAAVLAVAQQQHSTYHQ